MTPHRIASHRITSYRIASHRIDLHSITSHRIASHHSASITSHRIASHHATPRHIATHCPRHDAPRRATPRRAAPRRATASHATTLRVIFALHDGTCMCTIKPSRFHVIASLQRLGSGAGASLEDRIDGPDTVRSAAAAKPSASHPGAAAQGTGGTTCLTLLVERRYSSKVANHVANYDDPLQDEARRKQTRP